MAGGAAGLVVFLLAWTQSPDKRGLRLPLAVGAVAAGAAGTVLFWLARQQGHFLGDGPNRIEGLIQGRFAWYLEPGGLLIPDYLHKLFGSADPALTFAVLSVVCGMAYVVLSAWFAHEVAGDAWGRGLVFGLLALAGLTRLFYGYVETAPLLAAVVMLYLVLAVVYLRGKGSPLAIVLAGTVALFVHPTAILLLPSVIYVLWRGPEKGGNGRGRRLSLLLIPAAVLGGGHLYLLSIDAGLTDVYRYYWENILPWTGEGSARVKYSVFSTGHLRDFIQHEILIGPFAAMFAIILLVLGARGRLGSDGRFLLLAGLPWWLFSFVFNHQIGVARQWSVFAPTSIAFLMVVGLALVRLPWRRERPRLAAALAGIILAVSVFHTLPWIGVGLDRDRSLRHFVGLYAPGTGASPFARSYAFDDVGTHYLSLGQVESAQMAYMEAVTADTTNSYAASHLGSLLRSIGKTRQSASLLEWAIRQDPGRDHLYYQLAGAYGDLGAPDSAATAYRIAIDLNPEFRQAYINLAIVERKLGRLVEAEEVLRQAEVHYPDDYHILANLAHIQQDKGDTLRAVELYKLALEQNPDAVDTAYNLGILLMQSRRLNEATAYLEMVVNRNPQDAEAWVSLGVVRDLLKKPNEALAAFQEALLADPSRPEPYFNIFTGLIARGDTARAITVMQAYALQDSSTELGFIARQLLRELGVSEGR
jgi:tetratricopeptide (TPR) repeat protein